MSPLWSNTDRETSKPKHLNTADKANCTGLDTDEATATNNGSGWTLPAAGNGNASAKREVLVAMNSMTEDVSSSSTEASFTSSSSSSSTEASFTSSSSSSST